ncbi:MAG TPA: methyltransferase domain-containing protein [Actinomycetota bacterium]
MQDWRTFDDVAEDYERIHAPRLVEPAQDLVAFAGIGPGQRVLDVGTGTGVAANAALGAGADVVGVDHSIGMLRTARRNRPDVRGVGAEAIDLPFRDGTFDVVLGSFVIAHFTKVETALFDLLRVLRPGGRLALTAWADAEDELARTWRELAESVVPPSILHPAMSERLPGQERFRDREAMAQTLMKAGVRNVRTEIRRYRFRYGLDEYVDGLTTWAMGRFLRSMLGEGGFDSFVGRARETFAERFADPVNDFREVMFGVGVKP